MSNQERFILKAYALSAKRCRKLFTIEEVATEWKQLSDLLAKYQQEIIDRHNLHSPKHKLVTTYDYITR